MKESVTQLAMGLEAYHYVGDCQYYYSCLSLQIPSDIALSLGALCIIPHSVLMHDGSGQLVWPAEMIAIECNTIHKTI